MTMLRVSRVTETTVRSSDSRSNIFFGGKTSFPSWDPQPLVSRSQAPLCSRRLAVFPLRLPPPQRASRPGGESVCVTQRAAPSLWWELQQAGGSAAGRAAGRTREDSRDAGQGRRCAQGARPPAGACAGAPRAGQNVHLSAPFTLKHFVGVIF